MSLTKRSIATIAMTLLAAASGLAQAAAVLTTAATTAGFGLSTFVSGIPNTGFCCGPLGIVNITGGSIMVSNYPGNIKVFADTDGQVWSSGVTAATFYGSNNPVGLATVGGGYYLAEQASGKIVEVNAAGAYVRDVVALGSATGLVGNPFNGHLYSSGAGGIWEVDPVANTKTLFKGVGADGLTVSADGSKLYAASGSNILGFDTVAAGHPQIFNSGVIGGGPDGTALGTGSLAGNIFVNTNGGQLIEIDLNTLVQTILVTGGSRGDFVWADTNNGTLLFTQTDSVLRLTAPAGSGFGDVPEPGSLALLGIGLFGLGWSRRRKKT